MGSAFPCPATNPTASSLADVEEAEPELADVLVADVPAEPSSGLVVATPEYSWAWNTMDTAEAVWTVTVLTAWALAAYHSSPSEKWPEAKYEPMRVQVSPAESVTDVIWLVAPV